MDANQFKLFMNEFKKLLPTTSTTTPQTSTDNLRGQNINFETFDPVNESFSTYKQRLENFLQMQQLNNNKPENATLSKQILINSLGSKNFQLLCGIITPKQPSELTYTEIMKTLETHFCPPANTLIEQHKFLSRTQAPTENTAQYVTALKQLSASCDFVCPHQGCKKSISEIFLRAQFIRGLRDSNLREKLLLENNLTFDNAEKIATATEASREGNRLIEDRTKDVKRISRRDQQSTDYNKGNRFRSKSNFKPRSVSQGVPNRRKLDYKKLGIDGMCLRCARSNHKTQDCKIDKSKLKCKSCDKTGHVERVCIFTLTQERKTTTNTSTKNENNVKYVGEGEDFIIQQINIPDIFNTSSTENEKKFYQTPTIGNVDVKMEIDSGSPVTIISENNLHRFKINAKLRHTNTRFRTYTGQIFQPLGIAMVNVQLNDFKARLPLYVVQNEANTIMGRSWMRALGLDIVSIKNISGNNESLALKFKNDILAEFSDVFSKVIGCIPDVKISLKLRENATPVFTKHRPVPTALLDKLNKELDFLESQNIITKTSFSDWGSPIVTVVKPNSTRICGDYKLTVNPNLQEVRYPIPKIEDTFQKVQNCTVFCKLDMFKAYLHLPVDETSAKAQTLSTHRGCYRPNRLFNGISIAPNEFQCIMDQILSDLEGVASFYDDIIVAGETLEECVTRLRKCLARLRSKNIHLNPDKCKFFQEKISYLGHTITAQGIQKSNDKIEAVVNAPQPNTPEQVESFIGLVMYYGKFIPNVSTLTAPLRELTKKGIKFQWTVECQQAFEKIKNEILSPRVLMTFDPNLPITLATDASPTGIAGVLSHIVNGVERPVIFISRALTKTEQNYSQLDREALAVFWSIKRLYVYLCGRKFTLICDNKPLTHIFSPDKKLPLMSASRLIRYASFLSSFEYTVEHRKAELHQNVDYLSRSPLPLHEKFLESEDYDTVFYNEIIQTIESESVTHNDIAKETQKDPVLQNLLLSLKKDHRNPEFNIHKGIIFRNNRVYVPSSLHPSVLRELHSTHTGIEKMKMLARRHVYWPHIDKDIEDVVKSCTICNNLQKNPPKVPLHQWEPASAPWARIHIDYAGPKDGYSYFVLIDAFSNWPEVFPTKSAPTSQSTISILKQLFTRYGLPCTIVSDNATIFTSDEFKAFCQRNGIHQSFSAPNHPATNGKAERGVGTLKRKLDTLPTPIKNISDELNKILFKWRNTPLASGEKQTPAELFLNRSIRTPLDILRPNVQEKEISKSSNQPELSKSFVVGEAVLSRNYQGEKWTHGTVKRKLGKLHYEVLLENGRTIKRHVDQLRATKIKVPEPTNSNHKSVKIDPTPKVHYYYNPEQHIPEQAEYQAQQPPVRRSNRMTTKPRWLSQYNT